MCWANLWVKRRRMMPLLFRKSTTSRVHEAVQHRHSSTTKAALLVGEMQYYDDSFPPLCPRPSFAHVASAFR
jgi:hypothetical protein